MGANATKLAHKSYDYVFGSSGESSSEAVVPKGRYPMSASAFVYTKISPLYIDEDGQLAHEFYCEVTAKGPGKKRKLKKIKYGLIPQGEIPLKIPKLHGDLPVVMYEG